MYKENSWKKKGLNHRMVWVKRNLIDPLVRTPLPGVGTLSTRQDCSKLHQPGLEHFQGIRKIAVTHGGMSYCHGNSYSCVHISKALDGQDHLQQVEKSCLAVKPAGFHGPGS